MASRVEYCHNCHAAVLVKHGNGTVTCKLCLQALARVWWR